jgi:hypothetical protein
LGSTFYTSKANTNPFLVLVDDEAMARRLAADLDDEAMARQIQEMEDSASREFMYQRQQQILAQEQLQHQQMQPQPQPQQQQRRAEEPKHASSSGNVFDKIGAGIGGLFKKKGDTTKPPATAGYR